MSISIEKEKRSFNSSFKIPSISGKGRNATPEIFSIENAVSYGELLYIPDYNAKNSDGTFKVPYFCRSAMLEPFILKFDSIGEAAVELHEAHER